MPKISESIEISAPKSRVWDIISDLDAEPKYWWGTKSVKTLSKSESVVNREIVQNFGNKKISQTVLLKPRDEVEVRYLKGVTEGVKTLKLESIDPGKTKLTAYWDIRFPGVYSLMTPIISGHVRKGTVEALQRIKQVSEGKEIEVPKEQS